MYTDAIVIQQNPRIAVDFPTQTAAHRGKIASVWVDWHQLTLLEYLKLLDKPSKKIFVKNCVKKGIFPSNVLRKRDRG